MLKQKVMALCAAVVMSSAVLADDLTVSQPVSISHANAFDESKVFEIAPNQSLNAVELSESQMKETEGEWLPAGISAITVGGFSKDQSSNSHRVSLLNDLLNKQADNTQNSREWQEYQTKLKDAKAGKSDLGDASKYSKLAEYVNDKEKLSTVDHMAKSTPRDLTKTPIDKGSQDKHIYGTNNYKNELAKGNNKSVVTVNPNSLTSKLGTGQQVGNVPVGQAGSKERINYGRVIGYVDNGKGIKIPTTNAIVHYSKTGVHFVPAAPSIPIGYNPSVGTGGIKGGVATPVGGLWGNPKVPWGNPKVPGSHLNKPLY